MFRLVVHRCIYFNIPWEDTFNMLEMKRESMRRELAFARLRQGRSYRWSWRHMPSNREAPNTNKKREQKKRESEKGKRVRRQNAWTTSYTFPLISCLVNSHFILQVGPIMPPPVFLVPLQLVGSCYATDTRFDDFRQRFLLCVT